MNKKIRPLCKTCGISCNDLRTKYCSVKCQHQFQYNQYIKNWLLGVVDGNCGEEGVSQHIRRYFFEKYNSKCSKCFWGKVNIKTGKVPLTVNHIDGNYKIALSII